MGFFIIPVTHTNVLESCNEEALQVHTVDKNRPVPNVLKKLPIFLCCNSSKSYLFRLLDVPMLLITAHALD